MQFYFQAIYEAKETIATLTDEVKALAAKNQVARNPVNTVFDAKRLIGRKCSDPIVTAGAKLWPLFGGKNRRQAHDCCQLSGREEEVRPTLRRLQQ